MWSAESKHFVQLDNFEITGVCNDATSQNNGNSDYIDNVSSHDMTYSNLYMHGWTNTTFGCGSGGSCVSIMMFYGGSGGGLPTNDIYDHIIVDGMDSDPQGAMLVQFDGMWQVRTAISTISSGESTNSATSCMITYSTTCTSDRQTTGTIMYGKANAVQPLPSGNAFYNNVFSNIYPSGSSGNVVFWPGPATTATIYTFNNVFTGVNGGGNYFNIGQNGADQGTMVIFNNTFEALTMLV